MKKSLYIPMIIFCFFFGAVLFAQEKGIYGMFMKENELYRIERGVRVRERPSLVLNNLQRYSAIWSAQAIPAANRIAWNALRKRYPDKKVFYYVTGTTARLGNFSGKLSYPDYEYISTVHPEWFLLSDIRDPLRKDPSLLSNRIRWRAAKKGGTYYNRFYLDIGNREFQEWMAGQFLNCVSGKKQSLPKGYHGLAMDNIYPGSKFHWLITKENPNWKYAGKLEEWNSAVFQYLKVVKGKLNKHGYKLIVNHTLDRDYDFGKQKYWKELYKSADGIMTEQTLRHGWYDDPYFADGKWLTVMNRHEDIVRYGLEYYWACYPPRNDINEERFLFTYCSWLLINQPGQTYYFSTNGNGHREKTAPWYEVYDLPIGNPVSERQVEGKCWVREYKNAKIVVNPTSKEQHFKIPGQRQWLDWSNKVASNEFKLPPQTGRIFLPIAFNAPIQSN